MPNIIFFIYIYKIPDSSVLEWSSHLDGLTPECLSFASFIEGKLFSIAQAAKESGPCFSMASPLLLETGQ